MPENTNTPVNAAGVPLTLTGTTLPSGATSIDQSGVPAGIDGQSYTSDQITALDTDARQALLNQLVTKYAGVCVDSGNGQKEYGLEFMMTPADVCVYQELTALGASRMIADASAAAASTPATTQPVASEVELSAAPPAPSTEAATHVIVSNVHVSVLHRLVDDVERGVDGAEQALVRAFRRVFERKAA